jgi:crotonobetainyl-CoA:carnitine CoA-transferase CaiB-like acyl-CoA transferase
MTQALEHINVLDFTQVIAGPFATYQLASLGAKVTKLEQPNGGDQGRYLMTPEPRYREAAMSPLFTAVNSAKRSLGIDLKHDEARPLIEALIAKSDVIVENFKAGTMKRLGFDYDSVRHLNPNMIYCSISGYGQEGPRAGDAAYDPTVQAASGIMSINGFEENGPTKVGFWVVDMTTGMNAALAICAALARRERSGQGEYIDCAMLDTAVSLMSPIMSFFLNCHAEPNFTGNGSPGLGGSSTVYPTKDGFITVASATDQQFEALAFEVGLARIVDDPEFNSRDARQRNAAQYRALLIEALGNDTAANWERRFSRVGVPAAKNQNVAEVAQDAQVAHRGLLHRMTAPEGLDDPFVAVNLGFKFREDGPKVSSPPPTLGQHTDEVLNEIGVKADRRDMLREKGVIR